MAQLILSLRETNGDGPRRHPDGIPNVGRYLALLDPSRRHYVQVMTGAKFGRVGGREVITLDDAQGKVLEAMTEIVEWRDVFEVQVIGNGKTKFCPRATFDDRNAWHSWLDVNAMNPNEYEYYLP